MSTQENTTRLFPCSQVVVKRPMYSGTSGGGKKASSPSPTPPVGSTTSHQHHWQSSTPPLVPQIRKEFYSSSHTTGSSTSSNNSSSRGTAPRDSHMGKRTSPMTNINYHLWESRATSFTTDSFKSSRSFRDRVSHLAIGIGFVLTFAWLLFDGPVVSRPFTSLAYSKPAHFESLLTSPFCASTPGSVQYALMMDAGSTGSRIHVYRFNFCSSHPRLEDELFMQVKPGLSAYPEDPKAAADSLTELLDRAKAAVPVSLHACTPLSLKATAGLRMLKNGVGDRILVAVREKMEQEYPFRVVDVGIMDGKNEGLFAWITLNFLLKRIGAGVDSASTVAIMDLGGGSTQIVFESSTPMPDTPLKVSTTFGGRVYHLYQKSHDGYGLMQGRARIKKASGNNPLPCLPKGNKIEKDLSVVGSWSDGQTCSAFISSHLFDKNAQCSLSPCSFDGVYMPSMQENFHGDIYAFSYFYDIFAVPFGKVEGFRVGDLKASADHVCSNPSSPTAKPFLTANELLCVDLGYMYTLLNTGYSLPDSRVIKTVKHIDGFENGWALGAALNVLDTFQCNA